MLKEVLHELTAVEPQGILGTVQVQTSALGIDGEPIAVRRKPDRFRCITKVRQLYVIGDAERFKRLLCRCDRRICAAQVCKNDDKVHKNFRVPQERVPFFEVMAATTN